MITCLIRFACPPLLTNISSVLRERGVVRVKTLLLYNSEEEEEETKSRW